MAFVGRKVHGTVTIHDHHRQASQVLLNAVRTWAQLPYVTLRDTERNAGQVIALQNCPASLPQPQAGPPRLHLLLIGS